jgi:hypothetical protein
MPLRLPQNTDCYKQEDQIMQFLHRPCGQLFGVFFLFSWRLHVQCLLFFWEDLFKKMHTVWASVDFCFLLDALFWEYLMDGKKLLELVIQNISIWQCRHWLVNTSRLWQLIRCLYIFAWSSKVSLWLFFVVRIPKVPILLKQQWNTFCWVLLEVVSCFWE